MAALAAFPVIVGAIASWLGGKKKDAEIASLKNQIAQFNQRCDEMLAQNRELMSVVATLKSQNSELVEQVEALMRKIEELQTAANVPEREFNEMKALLERLDRRIVRLNGVNFLTAGPKAAAKSTFIKYKEPNAPAPEISVEDGTKRLIRHGEFMDSIGINFEMDPVLRLFCLLLDEGFPDTLIAFHPNERMSRPSLILQAFLIRDYYNVVLDHRRCFDEDGNVHLTSESHSRMDYQVGERAGFRMLRYDTNPISRLHSFEPMLRAFFPDDRIQLPDYQEHLRLLEDPHNRSGQAIKFALLKLFKQYSEITVEQDRAYNFMRQSV